MPAPRAHPMVPPLLGDSDPRRRTVLVSLLGLTGEAKNRTIAAIAAQLQPQGRHPVFVTDDSDFTALARERHFYVYLPPLADQSRFRPGAEWHLYLAQKMRLALDKWRPEQVLSPGMKVEEFIDQARRAHGRPEPLRP